MAGTGVVPMSRRALVAFLTGLAADLVATVTAETFDRAVPLRVGGALVDAHFTETASIERTLALLGRELAARTPADAERLGLLQGAVAAGYARALRTAPGASRRRARRGRGAGRAEKAAGQRGPVPGGLRRGRDRHRAGDIDGQVIEVNQALADMLGYTAEELLPTNDLEDFVHPRRRAGACGTGPTELLAGGRDQFRIEKPYLPQRRHRGLDRPRRSRSSATRTATRSTWSR